MVRKRRSEAQLTVNAKGQPVLGFPKLRPDRDGKVTRSMIKAYEADMDTFVRETVIPKHMERLRMKKLIP